METLCIGTENDLQARNTQLLPTGIVFIDSAVDDYESLMAGVMPEFAVFLLDATRNGVEQISDILSDWSGLASLHIVSHGAPGSVQLGTAQLNLETTDGYKSQLKGWANALTAESEILLYGCEVAKGEQGKQFIQQLAALTKAKIAASETKIGNAALDGKWELEIATTSMQANLAFQPSVMEHYKSTLGNEFRINSTTTNIQDTSSVTALNDGGFVATWSSYTQDGSVFGIYGQRYNASGNVVGGEFRINSYTNGDQLYNSVTTLNDGGFVVTWSSSWQDDSGFGIYGQRYNSSGIVVGGEFRINSTTTNGQQFSTVTALNDGGFVATWSSEVQDGSGFGIYGQRYNASGNAVGGEFRINSYTNGDQYFSSVTALNDGGFVATWTSEGQDGSGSGIYGQRYNSSGIVVGGEFRINSYTTSSQLYSSVTALNDGGFVATWSSEGQDGSGSGIYGQRYNSSGIVVGGEFRINSYTTGSQQFSSVTALNDGGFMATWASSWQDGSGWGIYGQQFDAQGNKIGSELLINQTVAGNQVAYNYINGYQNITTLQSGEVVFTWGGNGIGDDQGVNARILTPIAANHAPYIRGQQSVSVNEDTSLSISGFTVGDDDGGSLTVRISATHGNLALGNTINITGTTTGSTIQFSGAISELNTSLNSLTYTGVTNFNGTDALTIDVSDDNGTTWIPYTIVGNTPTAANLTLTVNSVNDTATISGTSTAAVTEDATSPNLSATGSLTVNDVDTGENQFSTTVTPVGSTLGSLSITNTGTFDYSVANSAVQYLGAGQTKVETFTVNSLDGTANQNINVTISGINDAPTFDLGSSGSANIAVFAADGGNENSPNALIDDLRNSSQFHSVTSFDVSDYSVVLPTASELVAAYDAILVYTNYYINPAAGNLLADYVDAGGKLVVATFAFQDETDASISTDGWSDLGRLETGGYLPFVNYTGNYSNVSLGAFDPSHPIFNGPLSVSQINGFYHDVLSPSADAQVIASWSDNSPLVALDSGSGVVGVTLFPNDYYGTLSGDYINLFVNTLAWVAGGGVPDATEDSPFTFTYAASDVDAGDTLTYTATLSNGNPLPSWLSFDTSTGTFSGIPLNNDVGTISVTVTVADLAGSSNQDTFDLIVNNTNDAPTLDNTIGNQAATEDSPFSYTFAANTFSDVDAGDTLTYTATLADGSALPTWLNFDAANRTFSGNPTNSEVGILSVKVTATDLAGAVVDDMFDIAVANTNDAPIVTTPIAAQTLAAYSLLNFSIPAGSFTDVDAGDVLTYTATLANGSPLPSWLTFNPGTQTFQGIANSEDSSLSIQVTATDMAGASISSTFALDIVLPTTTTTNTINGTPLKDSLQGTATNDLINGLDDNDILMGNVGDDTINGQGGNDILRGGIGNDILNGGIGSDQLFGDDGNDILIGGVGIDTLRGGIGNDILDGGAENDLLFGDDGNDTMIGGSGNDNLQGGNGDDLLYGSVGNDFIYGDAGSDTLWGGTGADSMWGGVGSDKFGLQSGQGADTVRDFSLLDDVFVLGSGLSFGSLTLSQSGSNALIKVGTETLATVFGVQSNLITSAHFVM